MQIVAVPVLLRPYVKFFYALKGEQTSPAPFRAVADGCPGILFQHSDEGYFSREDKRLPALFLFGAATQYTDLYLKGRFDAIGACFQPHALYSLFGMDAGILTDSCVDMELLKQAYYFRLSARLSAAPSVHARITLLCNYLLKLLQQQQPGRDSLLFGALEHIIRDGGNISLPQLHSTYGYSERNFERKFKTLVGISPKMFANICRFQTALQSFKKGDFQKMSDVAYAHDYVDQSHFIRAFKSFSGLTPGQYRQHTTEIVENLSALVY